jgi:hypothetical protein
VAQSDADQGFEFSIRTRVGERALDGVEGLFDG